MSEQKLKVGDRIVKIGTHSSYTSYEFDVVERLTPTLAVTKRGVKITNTPASGFFSGQVVYREHGDKWRVWQLSTPEIVAEAAKQKRVIEARAWLRLAEFTDEQVVRLKELFETEIIEK